MGLRLRAFLATVLFAHLGAIILWMAGKDGSVAGSVILLMCVCIGALSCGWQRARGVNAILFIELVMGYQMVADLRPSEYLLQVYILIILWTLAIIVWSAPLKQKMSSCMRLLGLLIIGCRCIMEGLFTVSSLHGFHLGFYLFLALFLVNGVSSHEHKRWNEGEAVESADGVLALSVLSTTFACACSLIEWIGDEPWQGHLPIMDQLLLTAVAVFSVIRHILLSHEVVDLRESAVANVEAVQTFLEMTRSADDALPPTMEAAQDLNRAVRELFTSCRCAACHPVCSMRCSCAACKSVCSKGIGLIRTLRHHRWRHCIVILTAAASVSSLMWNILSDNLPSEPIVLPLSARAAGMTGMIISACVILIAISSILSDMGYKQAPINDPKLRLIVTLKVLMLALKLIAVFAPGAYNFSPISPSDCVCTDSNSSFTLEYLQNNACWPGIPFDTSSSQNGVTGNVSKRNLFTFFESSMGLDICDRGLSFHVEPCHKLDIRNCSMLVSVDVNGLGYLQCFRYRERNLKSVAAHVALIGSSFLTWAVSLLLTFKNVTSEVASLQLQWKVTKPACLKFGYMLTWLSSKGGLLMITNAGVFGILYLVEVETIAGAEIGMMDSFLLVLVLYFGLALASSITNEMARVVEDPQTVQSGVASADGIRALGDPVILLSLPGAYLLFRMIYGMAQMRWALAGASCCSIISSLGVLMMVIGAGWDDPRRRLTGC